MSVRATADSARLPMLMPISRSDCAGINLQSSSPRRMSTGLPLRPAGGAGNRYSGGVTDDVGEGGAYAAGATVRGVTALGFAVPTKCPSRHPKVAGYFSHHSSV